LDATRLSPLQLIAAANLPDETEGWADYDKMQLTMSDVTSY
jgi:hypothetical protein